MNGLYLNTLFPSAVALFVNYGIKLIAAVIVFAVGIKLSKLFSGILLKSKPLSSLDAGVAKFLSNSVKFMLYAVVVISAAGILGIPYASFVAVLGSIGVAIGLALQGSLSNIASGILILINKPFSVGDVIESDGLSGTVSDIGFFTTSLKTSDNKVIHYPNSTLAGGKIINFSAMETRMVDITFSVGYESNIDKVKSVICETVVKNPDVLKTPAPSVRLFKCGESALDFKIRVWCETKKYWDVYFDITEKVKTALDENDIEIPFPKLDVKIIK